MDIIEELRNRKTYLPTKEMVGLLRVTRNTLCDWVRVGRLPAIRVGNAYLYDPRMMAEWLTRQQTVKGPCQEVGMNSLPNPFIGPWADWQS
jgi:excisionase family DNA binding protein